MGQTKTGMHMITIIHSYPAKPGKAGKPHFGVEVAVVDSTGKELLPSTVGNLVIKTL